MDQSHQELSKNLGQGGPTPDDPSKLEHLPVTYQGLSDHFVRLGQVNPFNLRRETFHRIEQITGRPLICYVIKTHNVPQGVPAYIDDNDLVGFTDLIQSVTGDQVDVFIVSNGGSAEAAERIVRMLRERFKSVRFIVPGNAYSAATLICFSGDEIVLAAGATLGPIDPQINGIPARAILRAFESLEARLKAEGPGALTAYMPLLSKYDLHLLEICKSAEELSKELAQAWLSSYLLKTTSDNPRVVAAVKFFSDYDIHKSHGRSIDRQKARELLGKVVDAESDPLFGELIRSLYNQYELWFDQSGFFKMFEDSRGINWGRQAQSVTLQLPIMIPPGGAPPQPVPQPGPPGRSG